MKDRYCYWTVVDGEYTLMAGALVRSARAVGVFKDFHIWADRPVDGALSHQAGVIEKWGCFFKLTFLKNEVAKLNYDYFVWLDADNYFVRHPGDVLRVMQRSPIHLSLESDLCSPRNKRQDWWGCPNPVFASLMRGKGVCSQSIFNVNGGLFIVHHDVIETVFNLACDFWHYCNERGYAFTDEPPLAYAMHMLCSNPYPHTLRFTSDLWASDWTGCYRDALPHNQPWAFTDYFTEELFTVNPAIVHAMRSKTALIGQSFII